MVVDTFNFTASTATLGCTVIDQYGNLLIPRVVPVETVVASNPSIYTASFPTFDTSRSGYFAWDNSGVAVAKHPFVGPIFSRPQNAPYYKPQYPAVKH